ARRAGSAPCRPWHASSAATPSCGSAATTGRSSAMPPRWRPVTPSPWSSAGATPSRASSARRRRERRAMSDEPAFEEALAELEALVRRLEQGELPLEESLAAFERGMALVQQLGARLDDVSQRVEVLLRAAKGRLVTRPLPPDSDDEE